MSRFSLMVTLAVTSMAGLSACAATDAGQAARTAPVMAQADAPNVLFIAIDDLRPDLGAYGHPVAYTPHIDAFADTALVFDNAFVSQAVCGPSRAALMTGLRPDTTGITTLQQRVDEEVPGAVTMSQMFVNGGYESLGIGKIYHHSDDDMAGWTQRFEDSIYEIRRANRRSGEPNLSNRRFADIEEMPDTINVREAQGEIARLSESGEPFFMAVGIHRPHLPFNSGEEDWARYDGVDIAGPINPDGQEGAPPWAIVGYEVWNYDDTPDAAPMPVTKANELRRAYLASVTYADRLVGDLLADLEANGLADNTIVVLWSDHGWKIADHNGWAKHSTADIDIRVPMMIRVPGMAAAGDRTSRLVETVDIYPTLAELTGLPMPGNLEGLSFVPLLSDPDREWKAAAFSQYRRNIPGRGRGMGYTVRTEAYRYTAWRLNDTNELVAEELYDLSTDPNESRNVADSAQYANVIASARRFEQGGWQPVRDSVN